MDSVDFEYKNDVNKGLAVRRHMARESRVIDMMGRLHVNIFFQERYMLNEVGAKIKLIHSKDAFCLTGCQMQASLLRCELLRYVTVSL